MKSKTLERIGALLPLALLASTLAFTGCATTAGGLAVAGGEQAGGDLYANAKLGRIDPTAAGTAAQIQAVADLTRVGNDLKAFVAGTLSNVELGAVEATLKRDGVALSSNTNALNQINSVLNIFVKAVSGVNGLVTPYQALAQGQVANIVSGFQTAIQTYEGQWSVTNPGAWPTIPPPTSVISPVEGSMVAMYDPPAYRFTR